MYIHAYQSFLWNRVVSRRIRQFGLCPVVGDFTIKDSMQAEIHGKNDILLILFILWMYNCTYIRNSYNLFIFICSYWLDGVKFKSTNLPDTIIIA